jgi:uncharacterized protein YceH (UPF0502 family)
MNLSAEELRVLGCLVEKEATTPDLYPLSTNALQTACNQRSSREPVVDYDESTVTATMVSLRERGLARTARGEGSRVYKHAHTLASALGLDRAELALLSVLMLRGPQTAGELRTRSERQFAFGSLADVDDTLCRLAEREPPLVRQLPRQPGRKEARWEQTLGGTGEAVAGANEVAAGPDGPLETLRSEVGALREELAALRARVDALEGR